MGSKVQYRLFVKWKSGREEGLTFKNKTKWDEAYDSLILMQTVVSVTKKAVKV